MEDQEYHDDSQLSKRHRIDGTDNKFETRFLLPSKVVGSLIGKSGANIKRLRMQYNANVSIPDSQGPERILSILSDIDNLCAIIEDIIPGINDVLGIEEIQGKKRTEMKLLIHQSQAGCIIGKGGLKIKELREITGCGIKIFSTCCPQSSDRVTLMMGNAPLISRCVREIHNLMLDSPPKGFVTNYSAENFDDYFASDYGGYTMSEGSGNNPRNRPRGSGDGNSNIRSNRSPDQRQNFNFKSNRPNYDGSNDKYGSGNQFNEEYAYGNGNSTGMYNARSTGNGFNRSRINNETRQHYDSSPYKRNNYSNSTGNPILDNQYNTRANETGEKSTTQVSIPKELAGAIIGKGGSRIRQIRNDSGASITIDEPLPGSSDRIISITGSAESIKNAQYLLQMSAGSAMKSSSMFNNN